MKPVYLKAIIAGVLGLLLTYTNTFSKGVIMNIIILHLALHFWAGFYFLAKVSFLQKFYKETKLKWVVHIKNSALDFFCIAFPLLAFTAGVNAITQYNITGDVITVFSNLSMFILLLFTHHFNPVEKESK